jgi:hypothetical protein
MKREERRLREKARAKAKAKAKQLRQTQNPTVLDQV